MAYTPIPIPVHSILRSPADKTGTMVLNVDTQRPEPLCMASWRLRMAQAGDNEPFLGSGFEYSIFSVVSDFMLRIWSVRFIRMGVWR